MKYTGLVVGLLIVGAIVWGIFATGEYKETEVIDGLNVDNGLSEQPLNPGLASSGVEKESQVSQSTVVSLKTSFGEVKIALRPDVAPETVANFVKLADQGFYDGLNFHRIVPGFVVQGGDPLGDGTGGPGYTLPAEINLTHTRGAIAMARLGDQVNPERRSSGSQFYIALQELPSLDGQYTVFGQVVEGMEVVDQIASVQTDAQDRPTQPVIIEDAEVLENNN